MEHVGTQSISAGGTWKEGSKEKRKTKIAKEPDFIIINYPFIFKESALTFLDKNMRN